MTWNHLDSDLCQHVITLINRALDSPDGPHKGDPRCCAPRQRLVVALLDKGLMKTITDLQELVQESLFNVSCPCSVIKCSGVVHPAELSMLGAVSTCEPSRYELSLGMGLGLSCETCLCCAEHAWCAL